MYVQVTKTRLGRRVKLPMIILALPRREEANGTFRALPILATINKVYTVVSASPEAMHVLK